MGLISGTPTQTGTFIATITATNAGGTGSANLNITVLSPAIGVPSASQFIRFLLPVLLLVVCVRLIARRSIALIP